MLYMPSSVADNITVLPQSIFHKLSLAHFVEGHSRAVTSAAQSDKAAPDTTEM